MKIHEITDPYQHHPILEALWNRIIKSIRKRSPAPIPRKLALSKRPILTRATAKKAPYAAPPKPLPKPKPHTPTPLELKQRQAKQEKDYAKVVQLAISNHSSAINGPKIPINNPPSQLANQIENPNDREREELIKQIRGESPRKPV